MPRKVRTGKPPLPERKYTRAEIILYAVGIIVVLSMVCGTIATAISR